MWYQSCPKCNKKVVGDDTSGFNVLLLHNQSTVLTLAGEHGVYVMLDMHQDGLSEYFCGEGLPHWAVKRNEDHWYDPLMKPFPAPFEPSPCWAQCAIALASVTVLCQGTQFALGICNIFCKKPSSTQWTRG